MRDPYWDILKGLGIIAVVMGHVNILTHEFSFFRLAIFFFVSGFLFKAEKCLDYRQFFLHKLRTLWKPFVLYNVIFFMLHDFFIYIGWIALQPVPEGYTMVSRWLNVYELPRCFSKVIFTGDAHMMCVATWFIAPFLINILIFAILVKVTYNKPAWQLPVLLSLFFALGVEIVDNAPGTTMYCDVAMFLLPITAAGFYFKKFCSEKNFKASDLILTWRGGILLIIAIGIFVVVEDMGHTVNLGGYKLGNWFIFLIGALSGIYLTMVVARLILLSNLLTKIFAFIGLKSFHIMALHFVGFKIFTLLLGIVENPEYYRLMSCAFVPATSDSLYATFGVCVPLILCKIYSVISERRFS